MDNNLNKLPICVDCPHYKSVVDYECEVKAYGKEYAYQCKHRRACGRAYILWQRIQDKVPDGFPDGWTQYGAGGKEMSDNTRYKALGNSIAVPCAERVFVGIIAAEKEDGKNGEIN